MSAVQRVGLRLQGWQAASGVRCLHGVRAWTCGASTCSPPADPPPLRPRVTTPRSRSVFQQCTAATGPSASTAGRKMRAAGGSGVRARPAAQQAMTAGARLALQPLLPLLRA